MDEINYTCTSCEVTEVDSEGDYCSDCGAMCEACEVTVPYDDLDSALIPGSRYYITNEAQVCSDCRDHMIDCEHCGRPMHSDVTHYDCTDCGTVCGYCHENMHYCDHCEESYCDDYGHGSCGSRGFLHDYSYTPYLVFHNHNGLESKRPVEGTPYLGLELEVSGDEDLCEGIEDEHPELLYCKEDGSVDGFEMVTHPMTYEWAIDYFPWALLRTLYANGGRGGSNGIHVHISRNAFTDEAHILRWLLLIYRNKQSLVKFARRESSQWADFNEPTSVLHEKAKGGYGHKRYAAVNAQNDNTLEVRIFRSSLNPEKVQAALGFVAASYEYTKDMPQSAAFDGSLGWQTFAEWVSNQPKYAPVYQQMIKQDTLELALFS